MTYTLFVVLICLASILMIGIVLIQESKGGGLASNFSSQNNLLGVRKTTDFIEKATWTLAAAMVVLSIVCAYVVPSASDEQSVFEQNAIETQTTNPNTTPGFATGEQKSAPAKSTNQQPAAPAQQAPAAKK